MSFSRAAVPALQQIVPLPDTEKCPDFNRSLRKPPLSFRGCCPYRTNALGGRISERDRASRGPRARHHRRTADAVCRSGHGQHLRGPGRPADKDLKLSAEGKSVTVRLPEPQLDKPNLDHDRSYVFMQDRGVLDRIADAIESPQQAQFFKLAETKLAAAAEASELRTQAAENTKAMLTGVFVSLGIHVTFLDS
ncbi:DUF4230 domain-containing protein [Arthrobacter oryzae]|uniref:DUF4230 domain-containing protein n=1 Tax=Arthrobacter oryzae TaxID=409290 RepID=UPI00142E026C|nr:DUF4230 domain-containing protein [Arthrobacter oryzae]